MVRLAFEDFGKLSLNFFDEGDEEETVDTEEQESSNDEVERMKIKKIRRRNYG
jgi:hypothetical protein